MCDPASYCILAAAQTPEQRAATTAAFKAQTAKAREEWEAAHANDGPLREPLWPIQSGTMGLLESLGGASDYLDCRS